MNTWCVNDSSKMNSHSLRVKMKDCSLARTSLNWNTVGYVQKLLTKLEKRLQEKNVLVNSKSTRSLKGEISSVLEYDKIIWRQRSR